MVVPTSAANVPFWVGPFLICTPCPGLLQQNEHMRVMVKNNGFNVKNNLHVCGIMPDIIMFNVKR